MLSKNITGDIISLRNFILFFKDLFILFLAVLGLCCCMRAYYSCRGQGLLSSCDTEASHCSGVSCEARALGVQVSVVAAHGLSSCG